MSAKVECICGNRPDAPGVKALPRYGIGGWLALLYGISALPKAVEYQCPKCGEIFGRTTDREVRAAHR